MSIAASVFFIFCFGIVVGLFLGVWADKHDVLYACPRCEDQLLYIPSDEQLLKWDDEGRIPPYWVGQGWHFCDEFDGAVIQTADNPICDCYSAYFGPQKSPKSPAAVQAEISQIMKELDEIVDV